MVDCRINVSNVSLARPRRRELIHTRKSIQMRALQRNRLQILLSIYASTFNWSRKVLIFM